MSWNAQIYALGSKAVQQAQNAGRAATGIVEMTDEGRTLGSKRLRGAASSLSVFNSVTEILSPQAALRARASSFLYLGEARRRCALRECGFCWLFRGVED